MAATTASRTRTAGQDCVRARVDTLLSCACGQALDGCHTHHCPRCGVDLAGRSRYRAGWPR